MKFFATFRAKLIFTIFPVIAGVTVAALLWTEWKFGQAYQRLFEEQFDRQIEAVRQARDRRADALSAVLERMARDPAIVAAMKRRDFQEAAQRLRPALESLGQERLQNELANLPRPLNRIDPRTRQPARTPAPQKLLGLAAPFITLVEPSGEFVKNLKRADGGPPNPLPPEASAGPQVRRKSTRMPWLGGREFADVLRDQEVAYLVVETGDKERDNGRVREQVHEVFVTPFRDPADGQFLGALVFGLPMPAVADRLLFEQSRRGDFGEIMGGTFVEGKLVSTTIPAERQADVAQALAELEHGAESGQRTVTLRINGVRHRLMYRVLNPASPFPQAAQVNLYSLAALDAEVTSLRRAALGFGVVALLVALLLVMIISRSLSGPVSRLVTAVAEISRGNYETRVPVGRDEIGQVSAAFNEMAAGLALQEKYRSVLHAVADRAVAERLLQNAEALEGEVREVAMLFCDIRGFTTLVEEMPPQEVVELLNEHMAAMTTVAYDHGGIVDKFVGDLIMVLFGAPVSKGDDALRAVRCAQEMLRTRRELNQTGRHSLEVGIGIATGSVVAGCVGSGQRLTYTVLGHRVNLASRLCSIAQPSEIVMDEATARALNGAVTAEPLEPLRLKGFSQRVHCYRITPAVAAG